MAQKQPSLFKSRGIKYLIALSIATITTTSLTLSAESTESVEPEKAAKANDKAVASPKKAAHPANTNLTEKQRKPINDYNITINYELGMHCTGFDFTYCCILPPYNSIQSQVIKTGTDEGSLPVLLGAAKDDPRILVDGDKRMKLRYSHVGNTYSEGVKLNYWRVPYDINDDGKYEEGENVGNAYFTHLYIYDDLEGGNAKNTSKDSEKKYVGIQLNIPVDHGPTGDPLNNGDLRYSSHTGTIVYTKSPMLDNTPIMLTHPGIWEALGLPLTPFFDDQVGKNPLELVESDISPFQMAKVDLLDAETEKPILDSHSGNPISFTGTNPIDVPNCANCHSNENANGKKNVLYKAEKAFWKGLGASDWIANLKATSVSVLQLHDGKFGTTFLDDYDSTSRSTSNRLGRDPVLCQKCHADNVIGVLNSIGTAEAVMEKKMANDIPLEPLSQAMHRGHLQVRALSDSHGRTGTCQGCHPAHRQDHNMDGYPITPDGKNAYALADNRDSSGGCYVGRDVHSNPAKDTDGAETPEHLNAIGQWLQTNISKIGNGGEAKGLWCTNCHNELSRILYQKDNITQAFWQKGETLRDDSLEDIAKALNMSVKNLTEHWMDPKTKPSTFIPKLADMKDILRNWDRQRIIADVAVIATKDGKPLIKKDEDGDPNVVILSANPKVDIASLKLPEGADGAKAVPYDALTHGRDYWLSPGVPHCADCHAAPYVEGQGGVAFPITQPGKYAQMRFSKGHAGLACQTCHQSIHGLYPVAKGVDTTTYNQAPQYNPDGSRGPLKCPACHESNSNGVPIIAENKTFNGKPIAHDFDGAVSWMHANAPDLGGLIPPKSSVKAVKTAVTATTVTEATKSAPEEPQPKKAQPEQPTQPEQPKQPKHPATKE